MKKRLLCGLLCLGLCLGSVQAAETGFQDVREGDWFAPYVSVCVDNGLMKGTRDGNFSPNGTITVAEAATIAARLRESATGDAIPDITPLPGESLPWYQKYVSYLISNGVAVPEPSKNASRQDFISLLSAVTPAGRLEAINSISGLPDTADTGVLAFYNAGITTGVDEYGTFAGDRTLTRSEAAAMLARVLEPSLRLSFTPKEEPDGTTVGELNDKVALVINGREMTAGEFASWLVQVAYYWDSLYYSNFNTRLTWSDDVENIILNQAMDHAVAYVVMSDKAGELGCSIQGLAAALTPSPTREELAAYVAQKDLLRAKHILVAEEASAQSIIDSLNAQPTQAQFDNILALLGTDPGMTSSPDGYLFTAGDMVEEFEAGTRALDVGAYSPEPVQSSFGFHVILRLDPLDHPDLPGMYQEAVMNDLVDQWVAQAVVQADENVLGQIDIQSTYELYLQSLSQG